ncbi:hypothetical protein C8R48DRAFT_774723 [Suillus tomentosus]|nr:hypothetical protein C8R48DRAFT_774723 [Suillus tomentosus]
MTSGTFKDGWKIVYAMERLSSACILKGKGIKLLTKDGQRGRFSGPEEALCRNLSDLDWPYMMNQQHGELLVDVGISFTPRSTDIPVVGVWRLDALEASFGAGGFKRGDIHHHNTLSRYGALSTYNLYYEAIRTNNNQAYFASDSDAYQLSPSYMGECFEISKVLDGCKEKTYGVRDEYRVSGHAAQIILDNIDIKRTQIAIVKRNPPNLGILTGVLNYMLRSTTSTPIIYDSHVCESLALLEYRNVLETAGMFFLQDFNLGSDDVSIPVLMGVNAKSRRNKAVERIDSWKNTGSEEVDYPIGCTPTWTRLKAAITNSPGMIMRPWSLSSRLFNAQLSVGHLIVMPYPNSLPDVMRCWTTTSIDDTLASVAFEACNAGLQDNRGVTPGRMGPRPRAFGDQSVLFFPDPEVSYQNHTQWSLLWNGDGYIAEFHRMMNTMDCNQQAMLRQGLRDIFSEIHCLPVTGARVWTQKNDAIVFTTNPAFYRIDCVGRAGDCQRKVTKARRTMKLINGKCIFAADLMDSQPFDADGNLRRKTERQKRREIYKKMTMTRKYKRVPPPPRPRMSRPFPMDVQEDVEGNVAMDVD